VSINDFKRPPPAQLRRIAHHSIAFNRVRRFRELGMELKPGDKAPSFWLATDGGGSISLSSLKGQPFVLYFYPKDDTAGCTREAIGFSENLKRFGKLRVNVVGVSKDNVASHDRFKTKYKLKHVLGSDPDTKVAQAYGVWGVKTLYGRKYTGMERAT